MSDLIHRADPGIPALSSWDPWHIFEELEATEGSWPAVDVVDGARQLEIKLDVPGMKESDVDLTITGRTLAISGQRIVDEQDRSGPYVVQRRFAGAFERRFELPPELDADAIEAELRDGVLTIKVAKTEAAKPHRIALSKVVDKVKGLLKKD